MKNFNSIQSLEILNSEKMSLLKGGASMEEINSVFQKGLISKEQFNDLVDGILSNKIDPNSLVGEWWGAGSL